MLNVMQEIAFTEFAMMENVLVMKDMVVLIAQYN